MYIIVDNIDVVKQYCERYAFREEGPYENTHDPYQKVR